jgi:glycosyltransferase involved in cell wall biosynthesis
MRNNVIYTAFVPHGINSKYFYIVDESEQGYIDYKANLLKKYKQDFDFILLWNNRNIRRKQPGDVILSYKTFCDTLPKEKANKVLLIMHTQAVDENGTNLREVRDILCPNYNVLFSEKKLSAKELNYLYNLSDVTINIASNEGFGLSGAESLMSGTPIINNVTGGLQDQCRFEDEKGNWINFDTLFTSNHTGRYTKHGEWAKPVFPSNRSLQGSIPTPYIFDDRCKFEDVAEAISYWYNVPRENRKESGKKGRQWVLGEESKMSAKQMCDSFKKHINFLLDNWQPLDSFSVSKVNKEEFRFNKNIGITK